MLGDSASQVCLAVMARIARQGQAGHSDPRTSAEPERGTSCRGCWVPVLLWGAGTARSAVASV